jgi:hypothetical protein
MILFQHLSGGTEKRHSQDISYPSRELNPGPPEHEVGMLTTMLRCSVVGIGKGKVVPVL